MSSSLELQEVLQQIVKSTSEAAGSKACALLFRYSWLKSAGWKLRLLNRGEVQIWSQTTVDNLSEYLFDFIYNIRFLHISPGALLFGDPSGIFTPSRSDDDNPRGGLNLYRRFQYFPSIRLRHDQVGDNEVKFLRLRCLDGLPPILN